MLANVEQIESQRNAWLDARLLVSHVSVLQYVPDLFCHLDAEVSSFFFLAFRFRIVPSLRKVLFILFLFFPYFFTSLLSPPAFSPLLQLPTGPSFSSSVSSSVQPLLPPPSFLHFNTAFLPRTKS
jgi:hypothetical protein